MSEHIHASYSYEQSTDATLFENGDEINPNMSRLGTPEEGRRQAEEEATRLAHEAAERPTLEKRSEAYRQYVEVIGVHVTTMRNMELDPDSFTPAA